MNIDYILDTFNRSQVNYLLIGGMNFFLRHAPVLTFDIDIWIENNDGNLIKCEQALVGLEAEWGNSDKDWGPVSEKQTGWLARQDIYCLTSSYGAIDIFRYVRGLNNWQQSWSCSVVEETASGTTYHGLSHHDMLDCQLALETHEQKLDRIKTLRRVLDDDNGI